jgi:hypothetical protein
MRICSVSDCPYPVFGTDKITHKGFCQRHQYLRSDKKKKPPIGFKSKIYFDFGFEDQTDLFEWLWQEAKNAKGEVICRYTGEKLNKHYNTTWYWNCFAHVLPKKNYPYWKLNPKNIEVVSPAFHAIIDQGTSLDRANHPGWKFNLWDKKKEELKIEYSLFKKQNLLP